MVLIRIADSNSSPSILIILLLLLTYSSDRNWWFFTKFVSAVMQLLFKCTFTEMKNKNKKKYGTESFNAIPKQHISPSNTECYNEFSDPRIRECILKSVLRDPLAFLHAIRLLGCPYKGPLAQPRVAWW